MAAKKAVEKNTITVTTLEDLNIVWDNEVFSGVANHPIDISPSLYEHLSGLGKISGVVGYSTSPVEEPVVEPTVEVETPVEEAE